MAVDIIKNTSSYLCAEACTKNNSLSQYLNVYNSKMSISFSAAPTDMDMSVGGIEDPEFSFASGTTLTITGSTGSPIANCIYGEIGATCRVGYVINGTAKSEKNINKGPFFAVMTSSTSSNMTDYDIYVYSFNTTTNKWSDFYSAENLSSMPGFRLYFSSNTYLKNLRCYVVLNEVWSDEANEMANRIKGSVSLYKDKIMCAPYYQEGYSDNMTFSKYGVYLPGELIENKTAYKLTKSGNIEASEFIEY